MAMAMDIKKIMIITWMIINAYLRVVVALPIVALLMLLSLRLISFFLTISFAL